MTLPTGQVGAWHHPVAWHTDDPAGVVVDYHAHAVLTGIEGRAGALGPEAGVDAAGCPWFRVGDYRLDGVRYDGTPFRDVELRIAAMDRAGIAAQVVSPNPLTYFHRLDSPTAIDLCRWHNDTMATLVECAPDRLGGFAQVPMQDPAAAADETRRAVIELGLVGPYIGTDLGPRDLDAPDLDEFWATCTDLGVPVFIHPGIQGTDGPVRDARLRRFDLDLTLGFAYEETMAVAQLVFGGVLHRHPTLRVCVSHGGGSTSWLLERWRRAVEVRGWVPDWLREPGALDAQLGRLWFDSHVGGPVALGALEASVGSEHLVFGTNLAGWDARS